MSNANSPFDPESFVRAAYAIAGRMDLEGWGSLFGDDGIFIDESVQRTYRVSKEWDWSQGVGPQFGPLMRRAADVNSSSIPL